MIDEIKKIIVEDLDINVDYDEFDENTPLFENGVAMDSIVLTEFILLLEKKFNFEFDDDDLLAENFINIKKINNEINTKLNKL